MAPLLATRYIPGVCHKCTEHSLPCCPHIWYEGERLELAQDRVFCLDGCTRFDNHPSRKKATLYAAQIGVDEEFAKGYKERWHNE